MLIPISDENPSRTKPTVTIAIIAINVFIYLLSQIAPGLYHNTIYSFWTMIPSHLTGVENDLIVSVLLKSGGYIPPTPGVIPWWTIFTSVWLHGGLMHLVGNMWLLWILGDNVEDAMGKFGFTVFYLFAGIAANLLYVLMCFRSPVPSLGASGAIMGVAGAYAVLYPKARIRCLLFFFLIIPVFIPAIYFLGFMFIVDFFSMISSSFAGGMRIGGIAFSAHVGGFIFGAVIAYYLVKPTMRRGEYSYHIE